MRCVAQVTRCLLLFALIFFYPGLLPGQHTPVAYRLDKDNGLPSNHVYGTLIDHLGYLWIATPKGAVRYNGYETKIFNVNSGLPKEDIWHLEEDAAGRIWLCTIANEFGYLYKGEYHPAFQDTALIYPRTVHPYKKGIVFVNAGGRAIPRIKEWAFYAYTGGGSSGNVTRTFEHPLYLNKRIELVSLIDTAVCLLCFDGPFLRWKKIRDLTPSDYNEMAVGKHLDFHRNYLYAFVPNFPGLRVIDVRHNTPSCNVSPVTESGGIILYACYQGSNLAVIGTENVYLLDSFMRPGKVYSYASLTNRELRRTNQPCVYDEDPLWGQLLSTQAKGIYIINRQLRPFEPADIQALDGFSFIGGNGDSIGYWWNEAAHELLALGRQGVLSRWSFPAVRNVIKFIPLREHRPLLVCSQSAYLADLLTRRLQPVFPGTTYRYGTRVTPVRMYDAAAINSDSLFALQVGLERFVKFTLCDDRYISLDDYWYHKIIHDRPRNGFWLYGDQKVCFYSIPDNRCMTWNSAVLKKAGIRKIEGMAVDNRYGNIFLKETNRLLLYHNPLRPPRVLSTGNTLCNGTLMIQGRNLVLYGQFGVWHAVITGRGELEGITVHRNFKNAHYNSIYDVQAFDDQLLMKTDKGGYRISLLPGPPEAEQHRVVEKTLFIVTAIDSTFRVADGDTVIVHPDHPLLQLDVINPVGTGALKLKYHFPGKEDAGRDLPGRELSLAALGPGFHELRLQARDDVWQSDELRLLLRIRPRWWQEPYFPWAVLSLALLTSGALIVVTRAIVLRRNARKQLLTEMALKGVHAQINPHFIFNTLSSTQYFIRSNKIKEAYDHINRFSRLLRNFLRASKHKYITIAEETENIKAYIELQQTRFEQRFSYEIRIDPGVDLQSKIPSLLLQPLIENAIQHGLLNRATPGNLRISFSGNESLCIRIEDNGIGRKQARMLQEQNILKQESYGSDLLKSLLYLFNEYEKNNITLTYFDKELPDAGTLVEIMIHNQPR